MAVSAAVAALIVVLLNLVGMGRIGLLFDLPFVLICVVAALVIRPREFFTVGVLPPLLMVGTIAVLAVLDRTAIAEEGDGLVQAVVSGLAHHATALVVGYALSLVILALRQIAGRNAGRLRSPQPTSRARPVRRMPSQRTAESAEPHAPSQGPLRQGGPTRRRVV